jgi:phage terminase large subunit-like protein
MIFTIDPEDNYTDKKNWKKANPMLGVSVYEDAIEGEVIKSVQNDSEKNSVLSRHFNVWTKVNEQDSYVLPKYVDRSMVDMSLDDPEFKGLEVCVGVDLSVNDDISSVSYMLIKDDIYYFFNQFYIPSEALTTKRNKERYKEAAEAGYIKIIEGNAIDYDVIIDDLNKRNELNPIKLISYDKYNAGDFVKKLNALNYYMVTFSQLASGMNKPLQELQRLFLLNKIRVQKNSLTQWMFSNVILKRGYTGLVTIDKTNSDSSKIDCVASMADALGGYLIAPEYGFNVW